MGIGRPLKVNGWLWEIFLPGSIGEAVAGAVVVVDSA